MGQTSRKAGNDFVANRSRCRRYAVPHFVFATLLLQGCSGAQSALSPGGREAESIADIFWWMTAGAIVIWLGVMALTIYAARASGLARAA